MEKENKLIRDFITYSDVVKGKSKQSIKEYEFDLNTFFNYILTQDNINTTGKSSVSEITIDDLKNISLNDLYNFLYYCKSERGNSNTTRARKCSTLRIFFKYLCSHLKLMNENPAELLETPKCKKSLPKYLDVDESMRLLSVIDGPFKERDYCIIVIFLNCGIRLSELCALNLSSIHSDNSITIIGKGNKERNIYLNDMCVDAINAYLKVRPVDGVQLKDKNALFLSKRKQRISNKTVQYIVKSYLEKAGLSGYSVHKLRHTAATLMYNQGGVDIRIIQKILGHENLGTTQIYTHVADNKVKAAIDSNPLNKKKD